MLAILNVTTPFFALVLCGYLAARYRMLPEDAVPALNTFVLYFALPCMLFRFSSGTAFREILNVPVFLAYMLTGLTALALVAATMHFAVGDGVREAAFAALAASWSNWGYMGIALVPALLGQAALFTIGVSLHRPDTRAWRGHVLLIAGAKLVLHPCLAGVLTIYVFQIAQLEVRTLVLSAGLPVAGRVFLFAERQGANAERIAAAILVSTALVFVSFSALCWAFGLQLSG